MCVSEILARFAADCSGRMLPSTKAWLARATAFSSNQTLKAAAFGSKVSDLVHVSPTDTLATHGLCRQPPFNKECIENLPSGIQQLLLLLEALLMGVSGKFDPLHRGPKGILHMFVHLVTVTRSKLFP